MRKSLKTLVVLAVLLATAGCGSEPAADSPAPGEVAQDTPSQSTDAQSTETESDDHKSTRGSVGAEEASEEPTTTGKDAPGTVRSTPTQQPYVPATNEKPASGVPVPKITDATRADSLAGRVATVEYFFAAKEYVHETSGASPLKFVIHPGCEECFEAFESVTEHYAKGGWLIPGRYEVYSSDATEKKSKDHDGVFEVRVRSKQYHHTLGGVQTGQDGTTRAPGSLKGQTLEGTGTLNDWLFYVYYDKEDRQNYILGWVAEKPEPFDDPDNQHDEANKVA